MIAGGTPTRDDFAEMVRLAVPVVVVQVGLMMMGVVDTLMVGRVSAEALASVALGNLYVWGLAVFAMGVLLALDPVMSQGIGAKDDEAVARALQRGLVLGAALSVLVSLPMWPADVVLRWLGQPEAVVPGATVYTRIIIAGVPPFFVFVVMRMALQSMGRLREIVIAVVLANVVNLALNWALIFGHLGAPAMGVSGSAWATVVSRWIMVIMVGAMAWRELRGRLWPRRPGILDGRSMLTIVRLGTPIGAMMFLEFSAFGLIAVMMGRIGTLEIAAHQVAINLASLTFMMPLGISQAAAVLVGRAVGAGDAPGARRAATAGLVSGAGVMAVSAAVFLLLPMAMARAYSNDAAVIQLAAMLIPIAGLFQVFDGLQTVASGVLRGVGDTRMPMVANLMGYYLVGIPASLALKQNMGAVGLWWGFVVGLGAVAALLLWRVRTRMARQLHRIVVEHGGPPTNQPG